MLSVMKNLFLHKYHDAPVFLKKRAQTLYYVDLVMISLLLLIALAYTAMVGKNLAAAYGAISMTALVYIVSLLLLKGGRYKGAANTVAIASTVIVIGGFFSKLSYAPQEGYTTYIYFTFFVLVQGALFSSRLIFHGIAAAVIASDFIYLLLARPLVDPAFQKVMAAGAVESAFSLIFVYAMSLQIININRSAVKIAEEEAEQNREQYTSLERLMLTIRDITGSLHESSEKLSGMSVDLSKNSQSQASAAEEIMSTVEEVSAGMETVTSSTGNQYREMISLREMMEQLSNTILEIVARTSSALEQAEAISSTARSGETSLSKMNQSIQKIGGSSQQMTAIVGMINDISDQINLLSLNAAIEAARAGEAGRGFAVVADEISKLADQTASSTREIDTLIQDNNQEIKTGMESVDETVASISQIVQGIATISTMISEIFSHMEQQRTINDQVNEVAEEARERSSDVNNSMEEQKGAVSEIVKSMQNINESTQANAQNSDIVLGRSQELEKMVKLLGDTLSGMEEA